MTVVNIAGSSRHIVREYRNTQPRLIQRATVTALNRANSKVFTESKRNVRNETGIAIKHFKSNLKKFKATRNRMKARVWMGLNKKVTLAAVNKGKKINGKWTRYISGSLEGRSVSDSFRATMPSGHQGIFVRRQNAGNAGGRDSKGRPRRGRLPIREVVLVINEAAEHAVRQAGSNHARPVFERSFRHEMNRLIERSRRSRV